MSQVRSGRAGSRELTNRCRFLGMRWTYDGIRECATLRAESASGAWGSEAPAGRSQAGHTRPNLQCGVVSREPLCILAGTMAQRSARCAPIGRRWRVVLGRHWGAAMRRRVAARTKIGPRSRAARSPLARRSHTARSPLGRRSDAPRAPPGRRSVAEEVRTRRLRDRCAPILQS